METSSPIRKASGEGEDGYILVAVIFLLAILILSLAVAIPRVKEDIQRDREIETMHRGLQYSRAIKLYYKKFNAYPPNIDALVKTNEIRFLRKRYTDPMTGKDDWKPVMFGQNKTPMAMGFFGQPLDGGGAVLAGTGPSGGNGVNGASPVGSSGSATGGSSFSNGSSFSSGGSSFSSGSSGSSFSSGSSLSSGSSFSNGSSFSGSGGSMFGSNSSDNSTNGAGTGSSPGSTSGSAGGPTSGGTTAGGSSSLGPSLGSSQTYGGGGIIGFSPGSEKPSILIYKKKNHYNEWEFLYSPLQDQKTISGGNAGALGNGGSSTSGQSGIGQGGIGQGGIGGQGGILGNSPSGNSPSPPSPTPTPQQ